MKIKNTPRLALVVPCYNEEEALPFSNEKLIGVLNDLVNKQLITQDSYILYVDDGSKDKTWSLIEGYHQEFKQVWGLKLSRNKGHQNALMAGLTYVQDKCDCCVSIDADLQDDIKVIETMVKEYLEGNEIVYGVRSDRSSDSHFKRHTAESFYKIMEKLGAKTIYNHADFRLMSTQALAALAEYHEVNLFLRGMIPELGFKNTTVTYERLERQQGESKYPLKKMIALALEGISSASSKPMFIIIGAGFGFMLLGVAAMFTVLIYWIFRFFSTIWFVGGFISFVAGWTIMAIGYVGLNVSKNYLETKHRPRYIIEQILTK